MGDGVLFFLRSAVAIGYERCANFVKGCEILDRVPGVMSEVSIGANVLHRKTIGHNNAVGGELFEYWLVVFLPGLSVIAALARLHLNEIIANERKRARQGRG